MIGMPPPTAASKLTSTPVRWAAAIDVAGLGQQRLVGGHHVLAGADGRHDDLLGDVDAPDGLHDDVDAGVFDHLPACGEDGALERRCLPDPG